MALLQEYLQVCVNTSILRHDVPRDYTVRPRGIPVEERSASFFSWESLDDQLNTPFHHL